MELAEDWSMSGRNYITGYDIRRLGRKKNAAGHKYWDGRDVNQEEHGT